MSNYVILSPRGRNAQRTINHSLHDMVLGSDISPSHPLRRVLIQGTHLNYGTTQIESPYFSVPDSSHSLTNPVRSSPTNSIEILLPAPDDSIVSSEMPIEHIDTGKTKYIFPMACAATINGSLYFFVAMAGGAEIEKLFKLESSSSSNFIYTVGTLAGIFNIFFVYKALTGLTMRPKSCLSWSLAILSPLASSSYLTAGIVGATKIGLSKPVAYSIGGTLFILRSIIMVDGAVKFPDKLKSLKADFYNAYLVRSFWDISKIVLVTCTSFAISISTTDSVYSAIYTIFSPLTTADNSSLEVVCYVCSFCGALGILPAYTYWINRGIVQLTNGGKADEKGINNDPTDIYTYLSVLGSVPTILGVLGSASNATGNVFGRLGTFSSVVRVSSSVIATIGCCVPGVSTILRDLAASLPSASNIYSWYSVTTYRAFNCCRRVSE